MNLSVGLEYAYKPMVTTLSYGSSENRETKDAAFIQLSLGSRSSFFWISEAMRRLYLEGFFYLGIAAGTWTNEVERVGGLVYYGPDGEIPRSSVHADFGARLGLGYELPLGGSMGLDLGLTWVSSMAKVYADSGDPYDFELSTSNLLGRIGLVYRL